MTITQNFNENNKCGKCQMNKNFLQSGAFRAKIKHRVKDLSLDSLFR